MHPQYLESLGPLADLIGVWEGDQGLDEAPSDERGIEKNRYRERVVFEPMKDVHNHEQCLGSLRYRTTIWEIAPGKGSEPFHEEVGYWLWDAKREEVLRCFLIPRGISIIAGGHVKKDAREFTLEASAGDCTHGICSNRFLEEEFKTVSYVCKVTLGKGSFSYEQISTLKLKGRDEHFRHTDKNTLRKVMSYAHGSW